VQVFFLRFGRLQNQKKKRKIEKERNKKERGKKGKEKKKKRRGEQLERKKEKKKKKEKKRKKNFFSLLFNFSFFFLVFKSSKIGKPCLNSIKGTGEYLVNEIT